MLKGYSLNHRFERLEDKIDTRFQRYDSEIQRLSNQVDFFVRHCRPDIRRLQIRLRSCQVSPKKYRPFRQLYR